jgi:hypothetical protein
MTDAPQPRRRAAGSETAGQLPAVEIVERCSKSLEAALLVSAASVLEASRSKVDGTGERMPASSFCTSACSA